MIPDFTLRLRDGDAEVEFDYLAHVDEADYSWSASAVLSRRPDGAIFYFDDCGCSCNYFASDATVADLKPAHSFDEALRKYAEPSEAEMLRKSRDLREVVYR